MHDFRLGEKYLSADFMRLVAYFDERARQDNAVQSVEFSIDKKDSTLRLKTRAGWEILLLENVNAEDAYKNLKVTLGEIKNKVSSLEYIDLRFGNKVFYKFK
ncbi:MAG: hypothetical protein HYT34_00740 [Candidatus Ryanbacteria bacterium]|nr:hypothetical protein [Candidatus Ryanbacteria bacterium]